MRSIKGAGMFSVFAVMTFGMNVKTLQSLTADQLAQWRKAAEPLEKTWADGVKKVGGDPDAVMKELKAQLQQVEDRHPHLGLAIDLEVQLATDLEAEPAMRRLIDIYYRLLNLLRSNNATCITQKPIVRIGHPDDRLFSGLIQLFFRVDATAEEAADWNDGTDGAAGADPLQQSAIEMLARGGRLNILGFVIRLAAEKSSPTHRNQLLHVARVLRERRIALEDLLGDRTRAGPIAAFERSTCQRI